MNLPAVGRAGRRGSREGLWESLPELNARGQADSAFTDISGNDDLMGLAIPAFAFKD